MTPRQVVTDLIRAFTKQVGARRASQLRRKADDDWWFPLLAMADVLIEERIPPDSYIRYVCDGIRKQRGRAPFVNEVFSLRRIAYNEKNPMQVWLRSFRKDEASYINLPTYEASPDRRRLHAERIEACLLPRAHTD